jgi:hypothetical protein
MSRLYVVAFQAAIGGQLVAIAASETLPAAQDWRDEAESKLGALTYHTLASLTMVGGLSSSCDWMTTSRKAVMSLLQPVRVPAPVERHWIGPIREEVSD